MPCKIFVKCLANEQTVHCIFFGSRALQTFAPVLQLLKSSTFPPCFCHLQSTDRLTSGWRGWSCMRWEFAVAIHTLCILRCTTANGCLPSSPLKFQDQHDDDRKLVTLSGNQLTITPFSSTDRFSTPVLAMDCTRLFLRVVAIHSFITHTHTQN